MSSARRRSAAPRAHLLPFAAVVLFGLVTLTGWWSGQASWVQPRPYDPALPANAALGITLLAIAPILSAFRCRRTATALALLASLLGAAAFAEDVFGSAVGWDDLLVRHEKLVAGLHVGRVNAGLAVVLGAGGVLLAWIFQPQTFSRRSVLIALAGSLTAAYGTTAAVAGKLDFARIDFWRTYAQLGLPVALALVVLGGAMIWLAALDSRGIRNPGGPRWLWLPVVLAGVTTTLLFNLGLRARETAFSNDTTQITLNTIASLYSNEIENQVEKLSQMAVRWTDADSVTEATWESEARANFGGFPACRVVSLLSADRRARWIWPKRGNEVAVDLDHGTDPTRRTALDAAAAAHSFAIVPLLGPPAADATLAIYVPLTGESRPSGYVGGEFSYAPLFDRVDRRLNISSRYQFSAAIADPATPGQWLPAYGTATPLAGVDRRLRQGAVFNLFNQRLSLQLTPRPGTGDRNQAFLPALELASGLGVSVLLGLVVNLAQAARRRQFAAERNAGMLREENEERRRIEARLKTTDDRLHLALDSTQVGVYEWEVPTGHVLYSPSVWTSLGYEPSEMAPDIRAWLELMHPEDAGAYHAAVDAHFRGESPFIELEYRIRHRDRSWHWFSARAKCVAWDELGNPLRVTGTCQNVTVRRKAEEDLRASQAATRLLTHVARRTANVVFITTPAGNIEWTNDSFTRLTGYAASEVAGAYLLDLLASPDHAPRALDDITQAFMKVEPITNEVIARTRQGDQSFHLRLELQPVKNDRGQAENFIVIGTDITTSVQTEATLRRAKQEADSASRAKSEFLATMSHEIRTPMNGVIGMTSLLLETPLSTEQQEYVNTIRASGNALLEIINEILDFSKVEAGRMELEPQPFELAQCIEEALDIFTLQAAAKNIEIAYRVDPGLPPWVMQDATRVRQVLVNLVNNAVKFTVQGQVTIEVAPTMVPSADRTRPPMPHEEAGKVMIDFAVRDTGIGIPADRRHLLFKPFSQVDSSTTRKYGGTGLGLAICDRLCQLMGGTITVDDNPGGGSVFHFSILASPVDTPPDPFGQLPEKFLHGRVLVVDDLPFNRITLRQALARLRLDAVEAAHLHDGTEIALQQTIVAALIDNDLLGEHGITLAEELRTRHPEMPVVLFVNPLDVSKAGMPGDPRLIRLAKPIKPDAVLAALSQHLGGVRPVSSPPVPAASASGTLPNLAARIPLEVLVVEDNPVNQKVVLRSLERLGYRADAVGNGLEALAALDQRKYDLVLMDLQMPEMDGLTATREIRIRYPKHRQPWIVALTANAMAGDRERCLEAGMDDYLAKPVKIEGLQNAITSHFSNPA
ncbi:MAG TPA: response regulator [Candidatus Didemnitutus sp.]|nr:response regulator [Candidatus Didemnitutus sp.]